MSDLGSELELRVVGGDGRQTHAHPPYGVHLPIGRFLFSANPSLRCSLFVIPLLFIYFMSNYNDYDTILICDFPLTHIIGYTE